MQQTEYDSIPSDPDRDGWITYLRDRLPFSFRSIEQQKINGTKTFVLGQPTPPPISAGSAIFREDFNLWSRALAFYAAGKVVDASITLNNVLGTYRSHLESLRPMKIDAKAAEIQGLLRLLNRNRLECERALTTLVALALEFIIKAMCVYCNYHTGRVFRFHGGHKLKKLYDSLPAECRQEIDAESRRFWTEFGEERQRALVNMGKSASSGGDPVRRKYLDLLVGHGPWVEGACPVDGWLVNALEGAGDLTTHRYGPVPQRNRGPVSGVDPYSTEVVAHVVLAGIFFLEHLFGVSDADNDPWQFGPQ